MRARTSDNVFEITTQPSSRTPPNISPGVLSLRSHFQIKSEAVGFKRYLKSGSGHAFAQAFIVVR
jgi:hypothetical protein